MEAVHVGATENDCVETSEKLSDESGERVSDTAVDADADTVVEPLLDSFPVPDASADADAEKLALTDCDGDGELDAQPLADAVTDIDASEERVRDALDVDRVDADGEGDSDGELLELALRYGESDKAALEEPDPVTEMLRDSLGDTEKVADTLTDELSRGVSEYVSDTREEPVNEGDDVATDALADAVTLLLALALAEKLGDALDTAEALGEAVSLLLGATPVPDGATLLLVDAQPLLLTDAARDTVRVADGERTPTLELAVTDTTLLMLGDCETEGLADGDLLVIGDSESLPETLEDGETEGEGVSVRDVPGEELTICDRGGDREVEADAVPTGERLTPLRDGHADADELWRGERDAETLPVPEPGLVGELSGERVEAPVPVFGDPDGVIEVEGQTVDGGDGDAGPLCDAAIDRESALREGVASAEDEGTSDAELPELALVPTDTLSLLLLSAENVEASEPLWPSEKEATPTVAVGDTVDSIVSVADIEGERDCAFDTDAQAVDDAHQMEVGDDDAESPRLIEGVLLVDCEGSVDTVARGLSDVKLDGVSAPLALAPTIDSLEHKLVLATALCEEEIVADALTNTDALAEPDVDTDGVTEGERCRLPDARALPLDRSERLGDGDSDAPAEAIGHAEGVRLTDGVEVPVRLAEVDAEIVGDALAVAL
jgi:hypothetical protein